MSIKEKEELYKKALSTYGLEAQMEMVHEECAELMPYVSLKETGATGLML